MPPQQTITREKIVAAAFTLVRKKGFHALSARNIARTLSCSTQPIYSCFRSMKALEEAVTDHARSYVAETYLAGNFFPREPFFSMGLGYIQMAKNDPQLFDLVYQSGRTRALPGADPPARHQRALIEFMKTDPRLRGLDEDTLSRILKHMWIYTHGLAMLARNNPEYSDVWIRETLHDMGRIMITRIYQEKGIPINEFFVINASPKTRHSITLQHLYFLEQQYPQHRFEMVHAANQIPVYEKNRSAVQELMETVKTCDALIWCFPVYYTSVPSQLKRLIELFFKTEQGGPFKGKYATAFTTSINFFDHTAHNYIQG